MGDRPNMSWVALEAKATHFYCVSKKEKSSDFKQTRCKKPYYVFRAVANKVQALFQAIKTDNHHYFLGLIKGDLH
ncbi:MAG: hypothetical protein F4044_07520 [Rhodobacteraceae bacterium]|nr:hypothetical protein [Paracoccaceae bacterium]MYJ87547.1 hypothetical protein [Paracoccaceae bacterium]